MQFVAERELAAAVEANHAVSGSVVVMNPYNGEILALASYPDLRSEPAAAAGRATSRPRRTTRFRCRSSRGRCSK